MDRENAGLFEEFDEVDGAPDVSGLSGRFMIRPARIQDVDALGGISAEREGGDAQTHSAAFKRAIEDDRIGHSLLILVAELGSDITGFGKVQHISREPGADAGALPEGWYLTGIVVDPRFRRRGIGFRLTGERLRWIAERSRSAYYFANARNRVSVALHRRFGFVEVARGTGFADVSFVGGEGILFHADLAQVR